MMPMSDSTFELIPATARSWSGMKRVLFQPFSVGKWFILGFTAWLAQLLEGGSRSGSSSGSRNAQQSFDAETPDGAQDHVSQFFQSVEELASGDVWIQAHWEWVLTGAVLTVSLLLAIVITLVWVSSRGKFMFLDNVIHNRTLVKAPWAQFRTLGNSLFRWNLVFGAITGIVLLLWSGVLGVIIYNQVQAEVWTTSAILWMIILGLVMVPLAILWGYISTLLEDFVIPLMWKKSLTTNAAWREFLVIHRQKLGGFVVYALWKWLLGIGAIMAIMIFGFATCCIAFIPMMIPYLGAVLLLPVSVFFRFLGPEVIREFGDDYNVWLEITPPVHSEFKGDVGSH